MTSTVKNAFIRAAIAAVLSAPPVGLAQPAKASPAASPLTKADQQIVVAMAQANMAEVDAGKLALANGQRAEVKSFAQRMIDDHTKALGEVTALAQAKGVTLPNEVDPKHKAMAAKLSKLKGSEFDRVYMSQAGVSDHQQVRDKLKKDAATAKDPDVKALAEKLLPTVEQHLHSAMEQRPAAVK